MNVGNHLLSQLHAAVEYLKTLDHGIPAERITSYLSLQLNPTLLHLLRNNPRINYDSQTELYEFRPLHNVRSESSLLAYLGEPGHGVSVKEIRDGWSDCISAIGKLEQEGKLMVIRGKRDGVPRTVWSNNADLNMSVDEEFKAEWHASRVPAASELPGKLEALGLKASSVDPAKQKVASAKIDKNAQRKRKRGTRGRVTNTHLNILRDFQ